LIFTGEFGDEKERGAVGREIDADREDAGGSGAAFRGMEFVDEGL